MLPDTENARLQELYGQKDRSELISYVSLLRSTGWTLQDIANCLGVQRSTVQYWERKAKNPQSVKEVPYSPREIEQRGVKTVKTFVLIPKNDEIRLKELSIQAKKISNRTPADSPLRQMSYELDCLIYKHVRRMVPVSKIAEAMGVTHRAVRARLERSNFVV